MMEVLKKDLTWIQNKFLNLKYEFKLALGCELGQQNLTLEWIL